MAKKKRKPADLQERWMQAFLAALPFYKPGGEWKGFEPPPVPARIAKDFEQCSGELCGALEAAGLDSTAVLSLRDLLQGFEAFTPERYMPLLRELCLVCERLGMRGAQEPPRGATQPAEAEMESMEARGTRLSLEEAQQRVLAFIPEKALNEEPVLLKDIAAELGMSRTTLWRLLKQPEWESIGRMIKAAREACVRDPGRMPRYRKSKVKNPTGEDSGDSPPYSLVRRQPSTDVVRMCVCENDHRWEKAGSDPGNCPWCGEPGEFFDKF